MLTLKFLLSGKTREVVEFRSDGWPICPCCNNDELAAITTSMELPEPNDVNLCHECGPIEVVEPIAPKEENADAKSDRQDTLDV